MTTAAASTSSEAVVAGLAHQSPGDHNEPRRAHPSDCNQHSLE